MTATKAPFVRNEIEYLKQRVEETERTIGELDVRISNEEAHRRDLETGMQLRLSGHDSRFAGQMLELANLFKWQNDTTMEQRRLNRSFLARLRWLFTGR